MALFADTQYFYPRSPCGERPFKDNCSGNCQLYFYPRSPCGERRHWQMGHRRARHFYPRSPCGERLYNRVNNRCAHCISIHALLAESDQLITRKVSARLIFLSTLSLRRATNARPDIRPLGVISIHALLAESDHAPSHSLYLRNNFYPRSPCGERQPTTSRDNKHNMNFYPRSPCGERLYRERTEEDKSAISIHALLAESDAACRSSSRMSRYFYPRSPCGERPVSGPTRCARSKFLSTLSLRRATLHRL